MNEVSTRAYILHNDNSNFYSHKVSIVINSELNEKITLKFSI